MRSHEFVPALLHIPLGHHAATDGASNALAGSAEEPLPKADVIALDVAVQAVAGESLADVDRLGVRERLRLPLRRALVAKEQVRQVRIPRRLAMPCADVARVRVGGEGGSCSVKCGEHLA